MTLEGGCRCGACRYTLRAERLPVTYACHCLDCQTMSGASFVLQAPVPSARLLVTGEMVTWAHANAHGALVEQRFCATCRTRLYSTNTARHGMALLRAGTLDDSAALAPAVHMWAKRRQPWIALPPDAEAYDEAIPPARIAPIFAPNYA